MAARELTRYPVARLRMINTSLVGGCFSHPPDYVMALSANLEPPGLWCLLWRLAKDDVIQDIADEGCYSFGLRLAAAADVAVATRHTAGVLWS